MVDVQVIVQAGMQILAVLGILYLGGFAFLYWKDRPALGRTLATASLGTIGLWILVLTIVALAWDRMFILFHQVFFTGETWLFPYTDTLIRLFPVTFWQDGFAAAVIGMLATCLVVWLAASTVPRWIEKRRRSG